VQLFADDAKLYSSINIDSISVSLPDYLDNLSTWANDWKMAINTLKCAVLSVTVANMYFMFELITSMVLQSPNS
jgi:hypothetical protein